jgi:hypothetical protein
VENLKGWVTHDCFKSYRHLRKIIKEL